MATCHEDLIHVFKEFINKKDVNGFNDFLLEVQDSYEDISYEYLFQKVYVHACLKKYQPVVDVLTEKYKELDPINKIALRQIFAYGNYLLKR